MDQRVPPTDLELAALISSRICHDIINPVGAIFNGLEILDEDDDAQAKSYALNVIRNVTEQASARLEFARFAFGAAGSAGAMIDLTTAEKISRGFVKITQGKHKLTWRGAPGFVAKDKVKLAAELDCVCRYRASTRRRNRCRDRRIVRATELSDPLQRHGCPPAAILDRLRRR